MLVFRVSASLFCLIGLIGPVHGQQALWDLGSSTVAEDRTGSRTELRLVFQSPAAEYFAQGAGVGAPLFEGERDGAKVTGIAWAFTARCPPESYEASGSFSADEKALALQGKAPVRDSTCKVTSFQDRTLVLTKKIVALVPTPVPTPAPPPVFPAPAPTTAPSAAGRSYWAHNGSTLYLVVSGKSREFYYDKPKPGMVAVGVQPGTLLFRGTHSPSTTSNGIYSGTAHIFSKRCGPQPYQVSGPVTNNYELITMTGQAPIADVNCNITRTIPDTLVFSLCVKVLPPGSVFPLCP